VILGAIGPTAGQIARRDGDAAISPDEVGTCGKARAAAARFAPFYDEDPVGRCQACDATDLTDVLHCSLDLELIPASSTITGSNTFTIMSLADGLTNFTFRLRSQFAITSALINGTTPVTVTTSTTTTRIAMLDRAYNTGEVFTLKISYSGVPVSAGGFGSIEFGTQNGQPLVQSLSEPYYAYTWWPCKDGDVATVGDNSDKFTVEMAITAPDTMTSVSNGLLQGVDVLTGNRKRFRWASNYPLATYLVFICSTVYNQWQQTYDYPIPGGTGHMPVQFSIYPANDSAGNRAAWEKCVQMLGTYRAFYGEYPFVNEKYGIYNFNFSGGQEHQTYTGEGTFSESVTSHELGHQWWGDNITCKTWSDIWLNEGFATYTEALWIQYRAGSTGWPDYFAAMNARRPSAISGTVYRTDVSSSNSIFSTSYAYRKPAWVLHSLRRLVGDATFFNILATYRAAFQGSAATTNDFAMIASNVAGQDLTWFFNEWIYGPGAPAYASGWQSATINGQSYLRLRIRQTQTAYPVFTMPIDVVANGGAATYTVWDSAATQWFLIPTPQATQSIQVDPNPWILATANATEAYVAGPPKIVAASPAPDAILNTSPAPSRVTVGFSDAVTIPSGALTLTGPGGPVSATVTFDPVTLTATLDAGAPLAAGNYTVTAAATITANALALDGEIHPPHSAGALPSGDGVPGGNAVWSFTIAPPACYADCDQSGTLNVNDFICFQGRFAAGSPDADCNHDTLLNVNDFVCFQAAFAAGCP
jgi:hypothetical protein